MVTFAEASAAATEFDKEGHVVIDDRNAHRQPARSRRKSLDTDIGRSRGPVEADREQIGRRRPAYISVETFIIAGQHARGHRREQWFEQGRVKGKGGFGAGHRFFRTPRSVFLCLCSPCYGQTTR